MKKRRERERMGGIERWREWVCKGESVCVCVCERKVKARLERVSEKGQLVGGTEHNAITSQKEWKVDNKKGWLIVSGLRWFKTDQQWSCNTLRQKTEGRCQSKKKKR